MARYNESDNSKSTKVVSSTAGFTAGDPIYNTSQGYKRIPDNYTATADFAVSAPKPWLPQNPSAPYRGGVYKVTTRGGNYGKGMDTLNNGNVVYAYHKKAGYTTGPETSNVYFRIDDASGNNVVAETQANVSVVGVSDFKYATVVALTGGNFVIAWQSGLNINYSIYQQDGTNVVKDLSSGLRPNAYINNPPIITPMPNGNWILSFRTNTTTTNQITYRVWGPTGTAVAAAVTYTGIYENCRPTPRADNTVFIWNTANSITGEFGYSILSSDLQTENVAASVDVGTLGAANQIAQVLDSDSDMHVIWQNGNNFYHLIMDSAGTTFDSAVEYIPTRLFSQSIYQTQGQPQFLELNSTQLIYATNGQGGGLNGYIVINKNKTIASNKVNYFHQQYGFTSYGAHNVANLIKVGTKFRWQVDQLMGNNNTAMTRTSKMMGYIEINSDGTIAYQETAIALGNATLTTNGYSEPGSSVAEVSMEAATQSDVATRLGYNTANSNDVVGLAPNSRTLSQALGTSVKRAYNIICTKDVGVYFIAWQINSTVYCSKMDSNLNLTGTTLNLGGIGYNNDQAWGRFNVCELNDGRFVIVVARNGNQMSIVLVEEDLSSSSINSSASWTPNASSGTAWSGHSICPIDDDNGTWFAYSYMHTTGDVIVCHVLDAVAASAPGYNPNNDIASTANLSLNTQATKLSYLQALPDGEFMCQQVRNTDYYGYFNLITKTGAGIGNWTRLGAPSSTANNTHSWNDMRTICRTNWSCTPNGMFSGYTPDTNTRMRWAFSNTYDQMTFIDIATYNTNDEYAFGQDGYGRPVACRTHEDDREGAFGSQFGSSNISFTNGSQYWNLIGTTGTNIYGGQIIPQFGSKCFLITNDDWNDTESFIFEITPSTETTYADFTPASTSIPVTISAERDKYIFEGIALTDCAPGGSGVLQVKGQAILGSTYKDLTTNQNFDSRTPTAGGTAGSQLGRSVNFIEE